MTSPTVDLQLLARFEAGLDTRRPEHGAVPARVLDYGELSTVLIIGGKAAPALVYKRLPYFLTGRRGGTVREPAPTVREDAGGAGRAEGGGDVDRTRAGCFAAPGGGVYRAGDAARGLHLPHGDVQALAGRRGAAGDGGAGRDREGVRPEPVAPGGVRARLRQRHGELGPGGPRPGPGVPAGPVQAGLHRHEHADDAAAGPRATGPGAVPARRARDPAAADPQDGAARESWGGSTISAGSRSTWSAGFTTRGGPSWCRASSTRSTGTSSRSGGSTTSGP